MNTLLILGLSLVACGDKDSDDTGGGSDGGAYECTATEPTCEDALFTDLSLQDDEVSDGDVTNTTDGSDFVSVVDASAGGYNNASQNPWVYVKFADDGLQKLDLADDDALEDLTWDLSLRRYIVRINGGDSGPGCVGVIPLPESTYADVSSVPDGIEDSDWQQDDFYTDDCTFINDSSGLDGSPSLILGQWWSYGSCVETTYVPFLLKTGDGRVVKLVIEEYYGSGQDDCNSTGASGDDSGMIKIRWQFLE